MGVPTILCFFLLLSSVHALTLSRIPLPRDSPPMSSLGSFFLSSASSVFFSSSNPEFKIVSLTDVVMPSPFSSTRSCLELLENNARRESAERRGLGREAEDARVSERGIVIGRMNGRDDGLMEGIGMGRTNLRDDRWIGGEDVAGKVGARVLERDAVAGQRGEDLLRGNDRRMPIHDVQNERNVMMGRKDSGRILEQNTEYHTSHEAKHIFVSGQVETTFVLVNVKKCENGEAVDVRKVLGRRHGGGVAFWAMHGLDRPGMGSSRNSIGTAKLEVRNGNSELSLDQTYLPLILGGFLCVFAMQCRFQFATMRFVWTNTGIILASAILVVVAVKTLSIVFDLLALGYFAKYGHDATKVDADARWGGALTDGAFNALHALLLSYLAKGWMISSPQVQGTGLTNFFIVAHFVCALAADLGHVFEERQDWQDACRVLSGAFRTCAFVVAYSNLVALMRISRHFPGAKSRGKVFGSVALQLGLWVACPVVETFFVHNASPVHRLALAIFVNLAIHAVGLTLLVWTFRPEILWELHGELPHRGAAKLIMTSNHGQTNKGQALSGPFDSQESDELAELL